ncbi:MAG: DNA mismatch repair endonuclease MutL [Cardiobacteriaceae bacterium]|nr:DNA mismatch repair endonuclease MutL [Cardiobacteriaceae bacterium]
MLRIQQLPNSLINQIAAGEVIERPASVVKEIVENAIDAGAHLIEIDIEDGGGKLIRVRDDGCGIHPDDLALAFATHATSKIRNFDDLEHVTTLGFRGEALPSIASVSKTTLTSRAEGQDSAWRITPHLGSDIAPAAHPQGTTLEIRDLFYNTPARKKFLKSERTERFHIQQLVQSLALSHENVQIQLRNHGKLLGSYGGSDITSRIVSVMGDDLLEQAVRIDVSASEMHLWGWVGLPTYSHTQTDRQHFFINGRMIRDKVIVHAIRQAYQDVLYHGRHPIFVLYLDINPELVDVNAHPAKHEVRFRESRLTHDFIYSSLNHALRSTRPASTTNDAPAMSQTVAADNTTVPKPQQAALYLKERSARPSRTALAESTAYYQWAQRIPMPPIKGLQEEQAAENEPDTSNDAEHPLGYALGQIHNIFILAQNAQGLVIVDMHAAHERILYERLKALLRAQQPEVQRLLIPQTLMATPAHLDTLEQYQSCLHRLGFELAPSADEQRIVITAVPALLKHAALTEIVGDLIQELTDYPDSIAIERQQDIILSRLSCHKAVRAHDNLSLSEMNQLLRDIETTPASGQCNHGRPTWIQLSTDDLGKYFMRGE